MKNEVKVNVIGESCVGKSHITFLIKKVLKENGFEIEFTPDEDYGRSEANFDNSLSESNNDAIQSLKGKTKIKIKQIRENKFTGERII